MVAPVARSQRPEQRQFHQHSAVADEDEACRHRGDERQTADAEFSTAVTFNFEARANASYAFSGVSTPSKASPWFTARLVSR